MTLADTVVLHVGYTPDSDDVFNYYAWEHGRVGLDSVTPVFERHHIKHLNQSAMRGEYGMVNISSVVYPSIAEEYRILAVGTSVGRGYGPVMVSQRFGSIDELAGRRVAAGGIPTTGAALAMMLCPEIELVEMPYDQIADAIIAGRVDAGIMIHEELVFYPQKGLHKIIDLGEEWCRVNSLPLPVGLNVIRRDFGDELSRQIARTCRESLAWAHRHMDEASAYASQFGRGCARKFVDLFSNDDTLSMPADVRKAMRVLFDQISAHCIAPAIDRIEVIDA